MFKVHPLTFEKELVIYGPVYWHNIDSRDVKFFDKDGFELTPLEQRYYAVNDIPLTNCLYNLACHKPWIEQTDFSTGVVLDHSMVLERYQFVGNACDQLVKRAKEIPTLWKLIHTKPKWGIDFSVDYITEDGDVLDVFHVEIDSGDFMEILEQYCSMTSMIISTDWEHSAKTILRKKNDWEHLDGHAQSNWKAQFFGLQSSEQIKKVF